MRGIILKKIFDTHGADSVLNERSGCIVEVIREIDRKEYDFEETGPMFKVRFQDGYETCAFEDELMELEAYK